MKEKTGEIITTIIIILMGIIFIVGGLRNASWKSSIFFVGVILLIMGFIRIFKPGVLGGSKISLLFVSFMRVSLIFFIVLYFLGYNNGAYLSIGFLLVSFLLVIISIIFRKIKTIREFEDNYFNNVISGIVGGLIVLIFSKFNLEKVSYISGDLVNILTAIGGSILLVLLIFIIIIFGWIFIKRQQTKETIRH